MLFKEIVVKIEKTSKNLDRLRSKDPEKKSFEQKKRMSMVRKSIYPSSCQFLKNQTPLLSILEEDVVFFSKEL